MNTGAHAVPPPAAPFGGPAAAASRCAAAPADLDAFLAALHTTADGMRDRLPVAPERFGRALRAAGIDLDDDRAADVMLEVMYGLEPRPLMAPHAVAALVADAGIVLPVVEARTSTTTEPLAGLAALVASIHPGGLLVERRDLSRLLGVYGPPTAEGEPGVIVLDALLVGDAYDRALAHELGHALDYAVSPDRDELTSAGVECFAERFAEYVTEMGAPSTVDELFDAARLVESACPRHLREPMPDPTDVGAVLAWALAR